MSVMTLKTVATATPPSKSSTTVSAISTPVPRFAFRTLFAGRRLRRGFRGTALITCDGLTGQQDSLVGWLRRGCRCGDFRLYRFFLFRRLSFRGLDGLV